MSDDAIDPRFAALHVTHDQTLRNELITDNRGLALAFARRYRNRGVPDDDLDQVAMEGLVRAVDGFDPDRGLRFSTYAARKIDGQIKQYFRDRTWHVKVPRSTRQLATTVQAAISALTQELGRSPTPIDLAESLGMELAEVTLALDAAAAYRTDSIDATERDTIPSASAEFGTAEAQILAPQLLQLLSPEVRQIVQLRFYQDLSQSEIALRIGVSQMQISRVLRKALATLRENAPLD